jgi:flagellar hook-basal body complex protein FliE
MSGSLGNIPTLTVTPAGVSSQSAADAYSLAAGSAGGGSGDADAVSFSGVLGRAIQSAVTTGETADAQAMQVIAGGGNITDMVTAVSRAQLVLQSTVAIRDRVVSAYQEIMRMSI